MGGSLFCWFALADPVFSCCYALQLQDVLNLQ